MKLVTYNRSKPNSQKASEACSESGSYIQDSSKVDTIGSENNTLFLYSKEALEELRKIFPRKDWSENASLEELAYNKGQQDVLNFIERRLGKERFKML